MNLFYGQASPWPRGLLLIGVASIWLIIAACSNGDGNGDRGGSTSLDCQTNVDSDGDGLTDCEELSFGTSIRDQDTDGDGLSDFEEVINLAFDPSKNNYQFNPLVADVPHLSFELTSTPDITVIYGASKDTATTVGVSSTKGFSSTQTSSSTETNSTSVADSHEGSVSIGLDSFGGSYTYTHTTTKETSFSWSEEQSVENSQSYTNESQNSSAAGVNYSAGSLAVTLKINNDGYQAVTLKNLSLSAVQTDPSDRSRFTSIVGNLAYDNGAPFQDIPIAAKSSTSNSLIFSADIDLGTALSLVKESNNLVIKAATWDILDDQGRSFVYNSTETTAKDAMVLIDYGPRSGMPSEKYLVATTAAGDQKGITVSHALHDILRIPYQNNASGALESVRGLAANDQNHGYWKVLYQRIDPAINALDKTTSIYGESLSYDFDNLILKGENVLHLVYVEDRDADGVTARQEFLFGTSDDSSDSDNDGRSDYEEIYQPWTVFIAPSKPVDVYSSPKIADVDGDTLNDLGEWQKGTDPSNPDTDNDGVNDNSDDVNDYAEPLAQTLVFALNSARGVSLDGSISAQSPNYVKSASIDWGDGSVPVLFSTVDTGTGTQSAIRVGPLTHSYAAAGQYTVSVTAEDSNATPNSRTWISSVTLTDPQTIDGALGYSQGWRLYTHIRRVVDIDGDGYDDIVGFANGGVRSTGVMVALSNGGNYASAFKSWSPEWGVTDGFPSEDSAPRWLIDLDNDGDLDLVGVKTSTDEVRYAINNGSGFDASQLWISSIGWNSGRDTAYIIDAAKNGLVDFVHASATSGLRVYRSLGGDFASGTINVSAPSSAGAWPSDSPAHAYPDRNYYPMMASDLDGDQCDDLVLYGQAAVYAKRSNCDGSFADWINIHSGYGLANGFILNTSKRFVEDVTADALPDLVAFSNNYVTVVRNISTPGNIEFERVAPTQWSGKWVYNNGGWADVKTISGSLKGYGIFPRMLADIDGDGHKDIVGFAGASVCIGFNHASGNNGLPMYSDVQTCIAPAFNASGSNWWADKSTTYREFFPRTLGDINGDGRADFIGFDKNGTVYQVAPSVTQFKLQ